ncbi:hypothetical protein EPUL_006031, partial [Erysiphe pulchra]
MVDIAKSRARARLKNKGLTPDIIDIDAVEASILDTESPDIEMIDAEIDRLISKGLKDSCWATPQAQAASSTKTTTQSIRLNINETVKEETYPFELQAIVEAEKRRAAQTAANLEVCTAAINDVETALLPLRVKTQKQFVDALKTYLRAAIAQFIQSGTKAVPPVLPDTPNRTTPA